MRRHPSKFAAYAVSAVVSIAPIAETAIACTRTLYVGDDNTVITGRNMDWMEDMASNLWVFPAGMKRDGAAGASPFNGFPSSEVSLCRAMKPAAQTA